MLLRDYLDLHNLKISRSPGDGHCLLYSILTSITNQTGFSINLNSLKSQVFIETVQRAQFYSTYIPHTESLLCLLHKYFLQKKYDTSLGDILPNIIANTLRINLSILNQSGNAFHKINILPTVATTDITVTIHRSGDHYNGLVGRLDNHRQQPRPVVGQLVGLGNINCTVEQYGEQKNEPSTTTIHSGHLNDNFCNGGGPDGRP